MVSALCCVEGMKNIRYFINLWGNNQIYIKIKIKSKTSVIVEYGKNSGCSDGLCEENSI